MTPALDPPDHLSEDAARVWRRTVSAYGPGAGRVVGPLLEEYCAAVATVRRARRRVDDEGIVVATPRGDAVPHPALAVERRAAETVRRLEERFRPPPRREGAYSRGYVVAATRRALDAAPEVSRDPRYAGAVAAVTTLAWVIDEAQRAGGAELRRAAYGPIPSYLKALGVLGLVPAVHVVDGVEEPAGGEGTVTSLESWMRGRDHG